MKNKFFSLILGLIVILATTSITSCERVQMNDASTTAIAAQVSNAVYVAPEVAQTRDVAYVAVNDVTDPVVPTDPANNDTTIMIIASVLTVLLTLLSILFKNKADRASRVINEISLALADRKVTTDEIKKIIAAWKGQ
jgi:cytochrome bd-type quinol oxidase subunit 2